MSKFWRPEDRCIPRRRTHAQSILKMENATCKSLVLRWGTLILYSVGYCYLSSSLPFLCHIPGQAEQLAPLNHISLAQDGKIFTSHHTLVKDGKRRALPRDTQRRMPWAEAGGSTVPLTQLHSELQLPHPRGCVQQVRSHLKIKVKLILALEEKHLKEMDFKEVALDEKHLEKKNFKAK